LSFFCHCNYSSYWVNALQKFSIAEIQEKCLLYTLLIISIAKISTILNYLRFCKCHFLFWKESSNEVKWKRVSQVTITQPLNVIKDKICIWLLWSNWPRFTSSQISFNKVLYLRSRFARWNHSVNVISSYLSQSGHNMPFPYY
jgi:hypothetical protein